MAKNSSSVTIPAPVFQMGAFPPICAMTGVPVNDRKEVTASRTSQWAALGIVGGVIGVLVLAAILRKQLSGSVPLYPKTGPTPVQRAGYLVLGAAALSFAGMFVLSGDAAGWAFLGFALFGIVGLGMVLVNSQPVRAELSADQQMVTLKNVDATFAGAVRAMMLAGSNFAPPHPLGAVQHAAAPYQVAPMIGMLGSSGVPLPPHPSRAVHTPPAPSFAATSAPSPQPGSSAVADPFRAP